MSQKIKYLEARLKKKRGLTVALSGGIDSGVLLFLASQFLGPQRVFAFTISSSIMNPEDLVYARLIARQAGVKHEVFEFNHLELEAFRKNPENRCYFCKKEMFGFLKPKSPYPLADGTQLDDLDDYRPGLKAIEELNICSPLKEAKITKKEIKWLARKLGLVNCHRAPSPCLATRFLPKEPVTAEGIKQVYRAEAFLKSLGFNWVRVRKREDLAIIEVKTKEQGKVQQYKGTIIFNLKNLGFKKVLLNLG
ncbi:hypothetical protein TH606_07950 [Thermodesulfatator autotrophicus]|uniref:Asparagine synthetase domain-containing protein n=1 Tax=Thermodesulfatator autotrophicus TaxID=1795632 RepID=A0A177E5K1_9BACT|nr:hypothetical protein TH606_07950 [Thermodesulfatator autotrophicus]